MTTRHVTLATLGLVALLADASLIALPTHPAAAQAAAPQATQQRPPEHRAFSPLRHIDGRIAFLKAELKITSAQAPQFDRVAQAMRENARDMAQAMEQMRAQHGQPESAVDRLEARSRFSALRAQASKRFLDAFKPLYASLSDDQKKAADELLARHGHRHHGRF